MGGRRGRDNRRGRDSCCDDTTCEHTGREFDCSRSLKHVRNSIRWYCVSNSLDFKRIGLGTWLRPSQEFRYLARSMRYMSVC